jgi:hypothetical protein
VLPKRDRPDFDTAFAGMLRIALRTAVGSM